VPGRGTVARGAAAASETGHSVHLALRCLGRPVLWASGPGLSDSVSSVNPGRRRLSSEPPLWPPDGSQILFFSDRTGSRALWTAPVQAGRPAGSPALVKAHVGLAARDRLQAHNDYEINRKAEVDVRAVHAIPPRQCYGLMVVFWVLTACHRASRFTKKSVLRDKPEMSAPVYLPFISPIMVAMAASLNK